MTAQGSARNDHPFPCPHCAYRMDTAGSLPAHVAMAHPEVPMDAIAPRRGGPSPVPASSLPAPATPPPAAGAALQDLPLVLVDVGDNVRVAIEDLEELAASIAEHGVLQPIKATGPHADGRYLVTWGQRRTLASRMAGRLTVPAIVLPPDADVDAHGPARSIEQLVENLHRADLPPLDRARAMRAVVDAGTSQADLARKLGVDPSTIANSLRLLELDAEVQRSIEAGLLTAAHGKALGSLPAGEQRELAGLAVERELSAHALEDQVQRRRQWKEQERASDAERRKTAEARKANAVAALEKAGVPKDAVLVVASGWYGENPARESVVAWVAAAGWSVAAKGAAAWDRKESLGCDCAGWLLTLDPYRDNVKVAEACLVHKHHDAKWKAKNADDQAVREHHDRIRDAAQAELTRAALAMVHDWPLAARMLLWVAMDWSLNDWVKEHKGDRKKPNAWDEISALPEGELAVELARFARMGFTDRYNVKLDWDRIERELAEASA